MMLSYAHRFIFVHIYHTGGTSIFRALGKRYDVVEALHSTPVAEVSKRLTSLGLNPEVINLNFHASAREIRATVGDAIFSKFFKFAFVRNPFDHLLSLYLYTRSFPSRLATRRQSVIRTSNPMSDTSSRTSPKRRARRAT